ncbi:hypothetical protein V6N13_041990 [Hibiscus sabdariffa]
MPLSTLISFFQYMETAKVPACLSMKRYMRRKKYLKLKRTAAARARLEDDDDENKTVLMLGERRRRGTIKGKLVKVEAPLRKWRDAYVEMMLGFAGHVTQLNNGNVHLFNRIPKPKANSQCTEDY